MNSPLPHKASTRFIVTKTHCTIILDPTLGSENSLLVRELRMYLGKPAKLQQPQGNFLFSTWWLGFTPSGTFPAEHYGGYIPGPVNVNNDAVGRPKSDYNFREKACSFLRRLRLHLKEMVGRGHVPKGRPAAKPTDWVKVGILIDRIFIANGEKVTGSWC